MVQRIYKNGDCKVNLKDYKQIIDSAKTIKLQFFVNSSSVVTEKTKEDINSEYEVQLNWEDLQPLGRGMLQYVIYYGNSDTAFSDGTFDSSEVRTTEFFIMSDIKIVDDVATNVEISELLQKEIEKVSTIGRCFYLTMPEDIASKMIMEDNIGFAFSDFDMTLKDATVEEFKEACNGGKPVFITFDMDGFLTNNLLGLTNYWEEAKSVTVIERIADFGGLPFYLVFNNGYLQQFTPFIKFNITHSEGDKLHVEKFYYKYVLDKYNLDTTIQNYYKRSEIDAKLPIIYDDITLTYGEADWNEEKQTMKVKVDSFDLNGHSYNTFLNFYNQNREVGITLGNFGFGFPERNLYIINKGQKYNDTEGYGYDYLTFQSTLPVVLFDTDAVVNFRLKRYYRKDGASIPEKDRVDTIEEIEFIANADNTNSYFREQVNELVSNKINESKTLTRLIDGEGDNSIKNNHIFNEVLGTNDFAYGRGIYLKGTNSFGLIGGISSLYLTGSDSHYKLNFNKTGSNPSASSELKDINLCANILVGTKIYATDLATLKATITEATADTANTQAVDIVTDIDLGTLNKQQFAFTSNRSTGNFNLQSGVFSFSENNYNNLLGSYNVALGGHNTLIGRGNKAKSAYSTLVGVINTDEHNGNSPTIILGMMNSAKKQAIINGILCSAEHSAIEVGTYLKTYVDPKYTDVYPTIVGSFNGVYDNNARFIIGGGNSEATRKNLLTVNEDGSVIDVNGKKFVTEDVVNSLIERIEALESKN